jgi:class 3 adenylate cyclase
MKRSRELRDFVLGLYHDWSATGFPLDLISASSDVIAIGTAPDEFIVGGTVMRAVMEAQDAAVGTGTVKVVPGPVYAFEEGTVGWATGEPTFDAGAGPIPLRVTLIFHKEGSEWKIVHLHGSTGVSADARFPPEVEPAIQSAIQNVAAAVEHDRPDLAPVTSREGTVTIVFTDIESSTAVNESVGDDRWIALLRRHNGLLREEAVSRGGEVVKSQGDGFMLAFPSARAAVDWAVAVQRGLGEIDSPEAPLRVRMGIHTGEPARDADDFYGRDVAYAARVGSAANGGEILISSLVHSLVKPSGAFAFDGPREFDLKGFEGPQPVHEVLWQSLGG